MLKANIPNLFTLSNLFCGCIAIIFAWEGDLIWCAYMVGLACVFDVLDGLIARILHVSSEIGKQLDSLADMVSFGVVPGLLLYKMIIGAQLFESFDKNPLSLFGNQIFHETPPHYLAFAGFLVTVFSAIRLAIFNIDTRQQYSFIGLPTPANTLLIASLPFCMPESFINLLNHGSMTLGELASFSMIMSEQHSLYSFLFHPYTIILFTLISSFLLVAPIPLFAFKFKNFSWKDNKLRYTFLLPAVVLLILFKLAGIPLIIILYIVLSIINNLIIKTTKQTGTPNP